MIDTACWKVGELARQTGLSVRTLHYYDEIGLLEPSHRSEAGHRLYTSGDITRLQRIRSLRELGFTLEEIQECLDSPDFALPRVIQLHLTHLRKQIDLQQALCKRLETIESRLASTGNISVEDLIRTIEVMTMFENLAGKYYNPGAASRDQGARPTPRRGANPGS